MDLPANVVELYKANAYLSGTGPRFNPILRGGRALNLCAVTTVMGYYYLTELRSTGSTGNACQPWAR